LKIQEIRELSFQELKDRVADKAEEFANLKFQLALHQLDNTASIRSIRREYARMITIAKEHELGIRKLSEQESGVSK
jgi:large subunit ribosomal protein L29